MLRQELEPKRGPTWSGRAPAELEACVESHTCGRAQNSELPKRLIDLDSKDHDNARLVETENIVFAASGAVRYVALSYCWGQASPFTTTSTTLKDRLRGFPVSSLPLTVLDAVRITHDLGIRYLWVDALCILQEAWHDPVAADDWRLESARMHLIYGNAFVTVVAAGAPSSDGGLEHGTHGTALVVDISVRVRKIEMNLEPISQRAWTQQEWLLSNRILAFTTRGVFFVCDNYRFCATQASYNIRLPKAPPIPDKYLWFKIIANYSSRNITEPRDRLPALAGLAQRYAALMEWPGEDYLAGLWRTSLIADLLWRRQTSEYLMPEFSAQTNMYGRCPGRAPSWSWAAINGPISPYFGGQPAREVRIGSGTKVEHLVEGNHFGEVSYGILEIRCMFMKGFILKDDDYGYDFPALHDSVSGDRVGKCTLDDPSDMEDSSIVNNMKGRQLILTCLGLVSHGIGRQGIAIVFNVEKGAFVRLGRFWADTFIRHGEEDFSIV